VGRHTITCLCPTYGRFERLQNVVACFLLQNYEPKCLMILNDAPVPIEPGHLPHGRTEIILTNHDTRFPTLGEKRQELLELADSKFVAHWDDDDLYLPWHLATLVKMQRKTSALCVKPADAWWVCGPDGCWEVKGPKHNQFEGQMLFDRARALKPFHWQKKGEYHDAPGGYPPKISGQALALMNYFKHIGEYHTWKQGMARISYCYRWRDGIHHISGGKNKPQSHMEFANRNRDFGEGPLIPERNAQEWARKRLQPRFHELAECLSSKLIPADYDQWHQRMKGFLGDGHEDLDRTHADSPRAVHEHGSPVRLAPLQPPAE